MESDKVLYLSKKFRLHKRIEDRAHRHKLYVNPDKGILINCGIYNYKFENYDKLLRP